MCQTWLYSYLARSKEELEDRINMILKDISRNEHLYSDDEYKWCIQHPIDRIGVSIEKNHFDIDQVDCINYLLSKYPIITISLSLIILSSFLLFSS